MKQPEQTLLQFSGENHLELKTFCQSAYFELDDHSVVIETPRGSVELETGDYVIAVDSGIQVLSKAMVKAIQATPALDDLDWDYLIQQVFEKPSEEQQERNLLLLNLLNSFK